MIWQLAAFCGKSILSSGFCQPASYVIGLAKLTPLLMRLVRKQAAIGCIASGLHCAPLPMQVFLVIEGHVGNKFWLWIAPIMQENHCIGSGAQCNPLRIHRVRGHSAYVAGWPALLSWNR